MEFNNLHIEGFCSIALLDINLSQKGTILIKGPNGVGKSTMIDAIGWVIYGIIPNGISDVNTWKHARGKDYKGTLVSIYFKNDNHIYKITRCYNYNGEVEGAKGRNQLFFYKDTILSDNKRKAEIQKEITDAIGMSYSLFMNSIFFGQGLKRLTQLTGANQKEIFDEIFDMSFITTARNIAREEYTKKQSKYNTLDITHKNLKRSLETLQNTLKRAEDEHNDYKKKQRLETRELKKKRKLTTKTLRDLEDKAPEELVDIRDVKEVREDIKKARTIIQKAKNTKDNISIEDLIESIIQLLTKGKIDVALDKLKGLKSTLQSIEVTQNILSDYQKEIEKIEDYRFEMLDYKRQRDALISKIDNYTKQIDRITREVPSSLPDNLNDDIDKHKTRIREVAIQLPILEKEMENYKWAYTEPLGNNGLKAYIFENSLTELNEILIGYSKSIGITVQYYMDTTNKRKEFTTHIQMEGQSILYEELSGGQKQLINLIMAFAMNELVSYSKGFNITFLDEVFENLSYDNIELVITMIRKIFKDKTLFLISHHDNLPIGNSKVIAVHREKGISHYKM